MGLLKRIRDLETKLAVLDSKREDFEDEFAQFHRKETWIFRAAITIAGSIILLTIALVFIVVKFNL
jgi:hypothetical protein